MGLENPLHIAILLVILLLLFGARRLPEMGRGLGAGIRSFKDGISGRDGAEPEPAAEGAPALPAAPEPVPAATAPLAEPDPAAVASDATTGAARSA